MGCEGLLAKPWNLRAEATLREFLLDRGDQWFRTIRQDPKNGQHRYGLGFTNFREERARAGLAAGIVFM